MVKIVFSSFLVGLVGGFALSFEISEKLRDRRLLFKKVNNKTPEELDAIIYQQKLKDRVKEYKDGSENELRKSVRTAINEKIVPTIRQGVDKIFNINVKEFIDSFTKK